MRATGLPKVFAWRWAPCAALVLGSLFFVGFALLVIPDRIGDVASEGGSKLGANLSRSQRGAASDSGWSSTANVEDDGEGAAAPPAPVTGFDTGGEHFPKRGFSPPLDRPEPAAPPPPPPVEEPPAAPAAEPPAVEPPVAPAAEPPAVEPPAVEPPVAEQPLPEGPAPGSSTPENE